MPYRTTERFVYLYKGGQKYKARMKLGEGHTATTKRFVLLRGTEFSCSLVFKLSFGLWDRTQQVGLGRSSFAKPSYSRNSTNPDVVHHA